MPFLGSTVRHALAVVFLAAALFRHGAPAAAEDGAEDSGGEHESVRVQSWRFASVSPGAADARGVDAAKVGAEIRAICAKHAGDPVAAAAEVFAAHDFKVIEAVAKAKAVGIDDAMLLADGRREMIRRAMERAVARAAPGGEFRIGAMDSGNKTSGIASDIDQTLFLIHDEDPKLRPAEMSEKVAKVIEIFNAEFRAGDIGGADPERYGIETMNGADFYPDWKARQHTDRLRMEAKRIWKLKSANSAAYRSEGELMIQALKRGVDALEAFKEKAAEADRAERAVLDARASGDAARVADAESALAKIQAECARMSPWIEAGKGPDGRPRATWTARPSAPIPSSVEIVTRYAFDGTWDNMIMFESHEENRPKYLLRSVAEGPGLVFRKGESDGRALLRPFDYDSVYLKQANDPEAKAEDLTKRFVETVYAHLPPEKRGDAKLALDTAALLRLQHRNEKIGGKPITEADVYRRYVSYLEVEAFTDRKVTRQQMVDRCGGEQQFLKTMIEAAKQRWASHARELMIENLLLTARETGKSLSLEVSDAEARRAGWPDRANALREVTRRQFRHAFHDLISEAHVRSVTEADEKERAKHANRSPDLVDRIIAATPPEMQQELRRIARLAAYDRRILGWPKDGTTTQAVWEFVKASLDEHLKLDLSEKAKAVRAQWKAGEYAPRKIGVRVLDVARNNLIAWGGDTAGKLGFVADLARWPPAEVGKLGEVKVSGFRWDAGSAVMNFATAGDLDSALNIVRAYQTDGPAAAFSTAAREAWMRVPRVSQGTTIYDLLAGNDWQAAWILGTAAVVPGLGHVWVCKSIAVNAVWIARDFVMKPLEDDRADKAYQGFLGKENGFTRDVPSQRAGILSVVPIRVAPVVRPEGTFWAFGPYTDEEAIDARIVESAAEAAAARAAGLLGGGAEFDEARARAQGGDDPRLDFDARRASLYPAHRTRALAYFARAGVEPEWDRPDAVLPTLREMYRIHVNQWLTGTGEYQGKVDVEVQELLGEFPEDMRNRIAGRMAQDFLESFTLVAGSLPEHGIPEPSEKESMGWTLSFENNARRAMRQIREEGSRQDATGLSFAARDATAPEAETEERAQRLSEILSERRAVSPPNARVRVRPLILRENGEDVVDLSVSVTAPPGEFEPPYACEAQWRVTEDDRIFARVRVRDAKGRQVAAPESTQVEIGRGAASYESVATDLSLAYTPDGSALGVRIPAPRVEKNMFWDIYRSRGADGPWLLVAEASGYAPEFVDSFPLKFAGTQAWRYVTVPKAHDDRARPPKSIDTSKAQTAVVAIEMPPLQGLVDDGKYDVKWDAWPVPPQLRNTPVHVQHFASDAPGDPFVYQGVCSVRRGWSRAPRGSVPGASSQHLLRVVTQHGAASEWASVEVKTPPKSQKQLSYIVPIAGGMTAKMRVLKGTWHPSPGGWSEFISKHDADGVDEGEYQRKWSEYAARATPANLAKREKLAFPWARANAPVAGARLGALVGLFVPGDQVDLYDKAHAGKMLPVPAGSSWFAIGSKGASFSAPSDGAIHFFTNWWIDGSAIGSEGSQTSEFAMESTLSGAVSASPAEPVAELAADPARPNTVTLKVRAVERVPGTVQTSVFLRDADGHGWHPWSAFRPSDPMVSFGERMRPVFGGLRSRLFSVSPQGGLRGARWGAEVPVGEDATSLRFIVRERPVVERPIVWGRRGDTLSVRATGQWTPVAWEGTKPYGPDGIGADEFRAMCAAARKEEIRSSVFAGVHYNFEGMHSFPARSLRPGSLVATFLTETLRGPIPRSFAETPHPGSPASWPMPVGSEWTFVFPEDGAVVFEANATRGWTGSDRLRGPGELVLDVTIARGSAPARMPDPWDTKDADSSGFGRSPEPAGRDAPDRADVPPAPPPVSTGGPVPPRPDEPTPPRVPSGVPDAPPPPSPSAPDSGARVPDPPPPDAPARPPAPPVPLPESSGGTPSAPAPPPQRSAAEEVAAAEGAAARGDVAAAAGAFDRAIAADPTLASARLGRAKLRDLAGDLRGAVEDLREAVRATPTDAARAALVGALIDAGDLGAAAAELETLERRRAVPAERGLLRAALELARGDALRAGEALAEVRRTAPQAYLGVYGRANTLHVNGQHERCLQTLRMVSILEPTFPGPHLLSGRALAALGRKEDARRAFEEYLKHDEVTPFADEARREIDRLTQKR